MIPSIVFTIILFLNISSLGNCATIPVKNEPALLVVSFDGFRPDYLNRKTTPHLHKFREDGTSAQFMMNVFPTKTFVNHFSIATVSMKNWIQFKVDLVRNLIDDLNDLRGRPFIE